jgi:putative solute:sodium symporter small subunit
MPEIEPSMESEPLTSDAGLLARQNYWKANLKLVAWCLFIWFAVSYGCGILLVDVLNQYSLFGFRLGFWFAQQGSIYAFLALIFFYAWRMNVLDRRFGVEEQEDAEGEQEP